METVVVPVPNRHSRRSTLELRASPFEFGVEPINLQLIADEHWLFLQLTQSPTTQYCNVLELTVELALERNCTYAIVEVPGTKAGTKWLIVSRPEDVDPIEYLESITGLQFRLVPVPQPTLPQLAFGVLSLASILTGLALLFFKRRSQPATHAG